MKLHRRFAACCLILGLALAGPVTAADVAWQYPVIKEFGKVRPLPEAALQPSPDREYKVLFSITKAPDSPDKINPGLEHIARLINVFGLAKVPMNKLKIVAVLHGPATSAALDDAHYRVKHQSANPNTKLIDALDRAGVTLYVCGQALAHEGFEPGWVNRQMTVDLSALTVLPVYQLDGYALVPD